MEAIKQTYQRCKAQKRVRVSFLLLYRPPVASDTGDVFFFFPGLSGRQTADLTL